MMNLNKRCTIKSSIHFGNLKEYIPKLWKIGKYVDVTLSCEGRKFKCHRIVLGAASRLLDSLFTDNQCQHPIVIIPAGITATELRIAIQFMYNGKVDLKMSELKGFMKVAQLLKIRGFRDLDSSDDFQLEMIEDDVSVHQVITIPENDEEDIEYNEDDDINDVNDDDDDVAIIDENDLDDDSDLELDYDAILAQETVRKPESIVQNKQDTKSSTSIVGKIRVTNNDFLFEKTLNQNQKHFPSATYTQGTNTEPPQEFEVKTEYIDEDESTINQEDDFAYENIVCAPTISYIYSNGANVLPGQSENGFVDFETSDNYKTYQKTEEKDGSKGEYPLLVPYSETQMSNQNSIWSTFYGSSKAIRSKQTVKRERKVTISNNPVILNQNLELTQDEVVLRSPRSNQPRTYSTKALYDALMAVKEGESIYRASREHSVPRKTLRNWMKRWNIKSKHPMPVQLREAAGRKKKKDETIIKFKTDIFANVQVSAK